MKTSMIVLAVVCTLLAGVAGVVLDSFLAPDHLVTSLPIAVMGGFILVALRKK